MTSSRQSRLSSDLERLFKDGADDDIERVVALITLVVESFGHSYLQFLHTQNMSRAKHGRHSVEADSADKALKNELRYFAQLIAHNKPIEHLKGEFARCNESNDWTKTKPLDKAREEIGELAYALRVQHPYNERVLDALLDVAYAGAEPVDPRY